MPDPVPVSQCLRKIIEERGLSPYNVSRKTGVSVTPIRRFLNEQRGLTLSTFERICLGLKLTLSEAKTEEQ